MKFELAPPASLTEVQTMPPDQWQAVLRAEPSAAVRWMTTAADLGHAEAQLVLGQWLLDGHGTARAPVEALSWFIRAAKQGRAMGMNMAGRCCEMGWGTAAAPETAAHWYQQAALKGLPAAMYNLGNLLWEGRGVARDPSAALSLYRNAADLGYAKAMTKIGRFYEDGVVVARDPDAAFFCYREAAEGGDFRGQFCYAGMLAARGQIDDAVAWLRKVPETATPAFCTEAGAQLLASPHPAIRAIGQAMAGRGT